MKIFYLNKIEYENNAEKDIAFAVSIILHLVLAYGEDFI